MNKRQIQRIQNKVYSSIRNMLDVVSYLRDLLEGKSMDKKMHQVTKRMKTAAKDIKQGEPKKAEKVLKKAEKKNEKLVKIDKNQRDPVMHTVEKATHKKGKALVPAVKKMVKAKAK